MDREEFREHQDKRDKRRRELATEYVESWMQRNDVSDKSLFVFEFGDEDGEMYGTMEHGDLFYLLPHIQISNH